MRSALPKPLHELCGRPMVLHVIDALADVEVDRVIVVVGHEAELVRKTVIDSAPPGLAIEFAVQPAQRGTGDATAIALQAFAGDSGDDDVIIMPGDTPLLRPGTIASLVESHRQREAGVTVLTAALEDASGYGRVVRASDGRVAGIVEHGDATDGERAIREINTSIYCFQRTLLAPALRRTGTSNAQGEQYLTDVVAVLHDAGYATHALVLGDATEAAGVNDRAQLASAEAELRRRINQEWMQRGVSMTDPQTTYVDASVQLSTDVVLLPGTILRGTTVIEAGAEIGPNAVLDNSAVGAGAVIGSVVAEHVAIGAHAIVESFATLGAGAKVDARGRVGAHDVVVP